MAPVDNHQIAKYLTELYDFISVLYFYLLLRKVITTADWANLGRTLTEWTGSSGTRSEHGSRHHYPAWWGEIWPRTFHLRTLRFVGLKTWWAHRTLRPKVWAGLHTARGRHLTWFWGPAIVRIKETFSWALIIQSSQNMHGQPFGTTVDCKTVVFFINFGFKRSSRASHVLPSLALRFIVYGRKKT